MSRNAAPQNTPSGTQPKTLTRKLVDLLQLKRIHIYNSKIAKQRSPPQEAARPEDYLTIHNLVAALKTVDFCQYATGSVVRSRQLEWMMHHWEESDKKFPMGCLEDAWYALQPRDVGCRPQFMVRNDKKIYPQVWHRPTVVRVQRCFYGTREYDDANGITCYQLGTIWTSNRPTFSNWPPPDPSGVSLLSHWRKTCFKLMVEVKGDEKGVPGCPTGAVWVVNNSGYHKKHIEKRAKTQLEGVLMARVADSLKDLVDCGRRSRWPKFEKADADYLDYYPCYQKKVRGPIVWKHAPDDECY
ncbi:hypothetical protein PG993_005714 [Apiospora rasikravindrae]|uniref:Uncharacterized protein n=1 Tax=Apiospora rasikravindrae TaxID=990691 RepID=A0ABR1T9K4_9PEZI